MVSPSSDRSVIRRAFCFKCKARGKPKYLSLTNTHTNQWQHRGQHGRITTFCRSNATGGGEDYLDKR